jgi:hypothetical protein
MERSTVQSCLAAPAASSQKPRKISINSRFRLIAGFGHFGRNRPRKHGSTDKKVAQRFAFCPRMFRRENVFAPDGPSRTASTPQHAPRSGREAAYEARTGREKGPPRALLGDGVACRPWERPLSWARSTTSIKKQPPLFSDARCGSALSRDPDQLEPKPITCGPGTTARLCNFSASLSGLADSAAWRNRLARRHQSGTCS